MATISGYWSARRGGEPRQKLERLHDAVLRATLASKMARDACSRAEPYHAVVTIPDDLRWTHPPAAVIAPDARRAIVQRLATATKKDMGIGAHLPWRITIAGGHA